MVWIKRNLWFVVSAAVGLLLTGYCSYLLYSALANNKGVSDEYLSTKASLDELQNGAPFPSKENIKAAKEDQARVRQFLGEFRKKFAPFPAPPPEDEKGFGKYVDDSLVRFRGEATNASVQLPPGYAFGFSGLVGKLNYPISNIEPWMEQLQEVHSILNIVYDAKVNYFYWIKRVPVSTDDATMSDCLQATSVTNQWGIVTPYQISFRGFSADLAAVLEGFARSSNCFIVKTVNVAQDTAVQTIQAEAAPQPSMINRVVPQYVYPQPGMRRRGAAGLPGVRPLAAAPLTMAAAAAMTGPPVTVFSESPLLITMTVDAVKLKATEP